MTPMSNALKIASFRPAIGEDLIAASIQCEGSAQLSRKPPRLAEILIRCRLSLRASRMTTSKVNGRAATGLTEITRPPLSKGFSVE